ncbi:MAG: Archaeal DNA polymerase II small subunit/DNA polymerase delta subunit B [Candidatus Methanohalarchaeum thermophilum]|uniref:DNA polymerase II small subunit n=1 Tax=Methanohalarchaeum thermophilum TaxID=1903181 RepID=A0A1Q6DTN3_METT1|nr:MAG: Archaeal DNA polymerase II small subunit/DNA polymerase delta subunit B [Candidatus Methanohalarchaeum thermophilum]
MISEGIFIHPEAKKLIKEKNSPDKFLKEVINFIPDSEAVILPKHIKKYLNSKSKNQKNPNSQSRSNPNPDSRSLSEESKKSTEDNNKVRDKEESKVKSVKNSSKKKKKDDLGDHKDEKQGSEFRVIKDITGKSESEGELDDFLSYFRDRFSKIKDKLKVRNELRDFRPIESLKRVKSEEISFIGIVREVRETKNNHKLLIIEDETEEVPAIALKNKQEVFEDSEKVLKDEIIGIKGRLTDDSDLVIINKIIWPDKQIRSEQNTADRKFYTAFVSDIHFGSKCFLEKPWNKFIKWLNGDLGGENLKKLSKEVEYLVIAGDIVEGIGIYPNQKQELSLKSIKEQYKEAAKQLSRIPDRVKIVLSPGNHDAVRQAEPQPALENKVAEFFNELENVELVGNPSQIEIDGVKILVYHGRSLDDLVASIPGLSYDEPGKIMEEFVRRRHLAPRYGGNTPLSPEKEDYMVVDDPDIIHSGHIHKFGINNYRDVTLLNTGTWQGQTKFMRKRGIEPVTGKVTLMKMDELTPKVLNFS